MGKKVGGPAATHATHKAHETSKKVKKELKELSETVSKVAQRCIKNTTGRHNFSEKAPAHTKTISKTAREKLPI